MSDYQTRRQPSACPVCGSVLRFSGLQRHLGNAHQLRGRDHGRVFNVAWREVSVALLGITDPQWEGP